MLTGPFGAGKTSVAVELAGLLEDAGAAYADLPGDGYTTRVQALSRRALGNSLVRLSLQQMQRIVLLLGTRARSAENLLAAVSALIATSPTLPQVHLLVRVPTASLASPGPTTSSDFLKPWACC